jgi:hypothetical protein
MSENKPATVYEEELPDGGEKVTLSSRVSVLEGEA